MGSCRDCVGTPSSACAFSVTRDDDADYIDLEDGAISPGLVSTGFPLGLKEFRSESSTWAAGMASSWTR